MFGLNAIRKTFGVVALAAGKVSSFNEKFKIQDRIDGPFPEGPCFWMHGASLGECKMLLSLAKILKEENPSLPQILITTQKVEVLKFLAPIADQEGILVSIAPLDTQRAVRNFMKSVKPVLLVLAENELWPGFLAAMRARSIRPSVALVSGRFYRCVDTGEFGAIGFVSMQTGADLTRFVAAGDYSVSAKTIVGGDWKLLSWAKSGVEVEPPKDPTVDTAFLSFHKEEWKPLSQMLQTAVHENEAVVLAPRFEEELCRFRAGLLKENIPTVEWPEVKKGVVSLVTTYGKLTEVLKVSKSSVIGGSFSRTLGVHDFWESLKMGVSTSVGPYSRGQQASVEALLREGAIAQIKTPADYATRRVPDVKVVYSFLAHEREKVISSYKAFESYIHMTLQMDDSESKTHSDTSV